MPGRWLCLTAWLAEDRLSAWIALLALRVDRRHDWQNSLLAVIARRARGECTGLRTGSDGRSPEHPRDPDRRFRLWRSVDSWLQGHSDAAHRRAGGGKRALYAGIYQRAAVQPDAGRADDRPLS